MSDGRNNELLETIRIKRGKWLVGDVPEDYSHKDLVTFAITLCNNHLETKDWKQGAEPTAKDPTHVALLAKKDQLSKAVEAKSGNVSKDNGIT